MSIQHLQVFQNVQESRGEVQQKSRKERGAKYSRKVFLKKSSFCLFFYSACWLQTVLSDVEKSETGAERGQRLSLCLVSWCEELKKKKKFLFCTKTQHEIMWCLCQLHWRRTSDLWIDMPCVCEGSADANGLFFTRHVSYTFDCLLVMIVSL